MDEPKKNGNKKHIRKGLFTNENFICGIEKLFVKRNKSLFAIILIIGILLMTLPNFGESSKSEKNTDDEKKLSHILSKIEGCGEISVMITYHEPEKYGESNGKAMGAVVVSDGADSSEIRIKISEAVQAALDLPPHKVKVYKSK